MSIRSDERWRVVCITMAPPIMDIFNDLLASTGHRLVGVLTSPGPKKRRNHYAPEIVQRVTADVDVVVSNHPSRWAAMLEPMKPDLIMCMGLGWEIPQSVIELPRLGAINGHPSLLPKYRGAGPNVLGWHFRNDEPVMGMTVHRLAPGFDTGPILAQRSCPIYDDDTADTLVPRVFGEVSGTFAQALQRVAAGDPGITQNEEDAFYAHSFEDEWRLIDWSQPARTIHNKVRSWTGFQEHPLGAFGTIEGELRRVIRTRLVDLPSNDVAPGSVLSRNDEGLLIQCGDGPLQLLEWDDQIADVS